MVTVSVAVYGDPATSQQMAVCPVAWFAYPPNKFDCANGTLPKDQIRSNDVGASKSCTFGAGADIACTLQSPDCTAFPIALAREQLYGPIVCPAAPVSRSGPSDLFEIPAGTLCGASATLLDFQIQQVLVDSALADRSLGLLARTSNQILGVGTTELALQRIDLYVVDNVTNPDFRCPSGVNVDLGGVDSALGRVRKITLFNPTGAAAGQPTFSRYPRL